MARRKKAQPDARINGGGNGNFKGFINHNMTAAEKTQFDEWAAEMSYDSVLEIVDRVVDDGYVISLKLDAYNDCTQCSLTCRNESNENFGFVLSGRAPTARDALLVGIFKHVVLLGGDWITFQERQKEQAVWG